MKLVNVYKNIWLADITGTMSVFINKKIEDTMNAYIEKKFDPVTVGVLTVCEDNVFEKPKKEFGTGMEVVSSQSIHIRAGLNDGPPDHNAPYGDPNDVRRYIGAIKSLEMLVGLKDTVIVHCWGGVSRSTFVVAAYIALKEGLSIHKSVKKLRKVYPHTNPHPKHYLEWDKIKADWR